MATDIIDVRDSNILKPDAYRINVVDDGEFLFEFGKFIHASEEVKVNILAELRFSDEQLALFIKSIFVSMSDYEKKTGKKMIDIINSISFADATSENKNKDE